MDSSQSPLHPARPRPMRQWLCLEIAAWTLLGVLGVTRAWVNGYASGLLVLVLWMLLGLVMVLWMRREYRKRGRTSPLRR